MPRVREQVLHVGLVMLRMLYKSEMGFLLCPPFSPETRLDFCFFLSHPLFSFNHLPLFFPPLPPLPSVHLVLNLVIVVVATVCLDPVSSHSQPLEPSWLVAP